MIGKIAVYALFVLSISATLIYFISYWKKENKLAVTGRSLYWVIAFGVIFMSAFQMWNIMHNNFQYTYIFSYSNTQLEGFMLASTFWAGQEGSLMLWTIFFALIGLFLLPYAKKYGYESLVMGLYSLILTFMFVLLLIKSPFEFVWETWPGENVAAGFMPPDGRGLNPILENYWMTIHPPILFLGYALLSVPFTFAFAGMIKKEYHNWIRVAIPWTLVAAALFTLGLSLGGFWSYETLGWGGFWAWDPVENASFLPWLIAVALIHTMKVQRNNGGLIRTNFILAMMTFVLVLYASFLTRSGILGESSVHSFAMDEDSLFMNMLIAFLFIFLLIGVITLIIRLRDIPQKDKKPFEVASKESGLTIAALLLIAMCFVVLLGTSKPLVDDLLKLKPGPVEISFYNEVNLPIVIFMMIISALSVFLAWRSNKFGPFMKKFYLSAILSVLVTATLVISIGIEGWDLIILIFSASLSLVANLEILIKVIAKKPRKAGAYLAHIGLAVLMIGVASLAFGSKSATVNLFPDETKEVFGYKVEWIEIERVEKELKDREKYNYHVKITGNKNESVVKPVFYWSAFNDFQQPFLQPGIRSSFGGDIYVSPNNISKEINYPRASLIKNAPQQMPVNEPLRAELIGYDMGKMIDSDTSDTAKESKFGAVIEFTREDTAFVDTLYLITRENNAVYEPGWKSLPDSDLKIGFFDFRANQEDLTQSRVYLAFTRDENPKIETVDILTIEFSIKPYIGLVWAGFVAMVIGLILPVGKPRVKNKDNIADE